MKSFEKISSSTGANDYKSTTAIVESDINYNVGTSEQVRTIQIGMQCEQNLRCKNDILQK